MKLIRKSRIEKIHKFNKISYIYYGIYFCLFCFKEVEKRLGDGEKCQSCGCNKGNFISESNKKRQYSEETRQKIKDNHKGMLGKTHPKEVKEKQSKAKKGKLFTKEHSQKIAEAVSGENHWNWQNGISFLPYPPEFNKDLKQKILERDNYTCQNPNCKHKTNSLDIHHIDYDKNNNIQENLITLCDPCHTKTNGKNNRPYWTNYYKSIIKDKL